MGTDQGAGRVARVFQPEGGQAASSFIPQRRAGQVRALEQNRARDPYMSRDSVGHHGPGAPLDAPVGRAERVLHRRTGPVVQVRVCARVRWFVVATGLGVRFGRGPPC